MKRNVSLVLVPIDDLTSKVITKNHITPWIEWEKPPIWKQGVYVFTDIRQTEFTVHIESGRYQAMAYPVTLELGHMKEIKIRLTPSCLLPENGLAATIRGTGTPGETVSFYSESRNQGYRLARDYKPGELMLLYHGETLDFSGKKAVLRDKNKEVFLQMGAKSEENGMEYPISILELEDISRDKKTEMQEFRKVESILSLVYETTVLKDGTFMLYVPMVPNDSCPVKLYYKGKFQEVMLKQDNLLELDSK